MSNVVINNTEANITGGQKKMLGIMSMVQNKGGFARVTEYTNKQGKVSSFTFNSNFTLKNLYVKRIKEISELSFSDLVIDMGKLAKKFTTKSLEKFADSNTLESVFETRKAKMIESMEKTIEGVQDSNIATGHARCSESLPFGRVYYVTAKDADGLMYPVLEGGKPVVKSIKVNALVDYTNNYEVIEEGEIKLTNSGLPVIMEAIINNSIKTRSFQNLSLENCGSLSIDGMKI